MFHRIKSVAVYCLGLLFSAFGVALSINADLGVSPVNSLPYIIAEMLSIKTGTAVIAVFVLYMLIQKCIRGKAFPLRDLLQLPAAVLFGYFVDFSKRILGDFRPEGYGASLLMLAGSIFLVALGISLYMSANIVYMPVEGLVQAITDKMETVPFHRIKMGVDCLSVALGVCLSFVFLGELTGIREGTVISAICIGKMIPLTNRLTKLIWGLGRGNTVLSWLKLGK